MRPANSTRGKRPTIAKSLSTKKFFTPFAMLPIYALMLFGLLVLTSCNSSSSLSEGLESAATPRPNSTVDQSNSALPAVADTTTAPSAPNTGDNTQFASVPTGKSVAFLPVSNAPQTAVTNLAKALRDSAQANAVPVVGSVEQGAQYQVKGYFSALDDGSGTLLVYVWDVLDRNNKRVYRINGQEQTSGKSSDPWSSVTPAMLDRVAKTTISQLKSWLTSKG